MPSIVIKNGKRRVRADVMVNGERKTKYFQDATKESQRQAAAWESETRKQIEQSQTRMECLRLSSWINDYLTDVQRRGMSKKVYEEKKLAFKRLVAFAFKGHHPFTQDTPVESITKFQVKAHFDSMLDAGRSGNVVLKDRKNLGAAWTWGKNSVAEWPPGENPFIAVPSRNYPKIKQPRYVPPNEDLWKLHDWLSARAASKDPSHLQDYTMFMVALHLAARRGEMFRMKPDDLDFSRDQVRLWTRKRKSGAMECDWLPKLASPRGFEPLSPA
jgi:integrase